MDEKDKKIHDLEQDRKIRESLDKEREESNKIYAVKLAEKAIFALIGLISIAVVGALVKVVLNYINAIINH